MSKIHLILAAICALVLTGRAQEAVTNAPATEIEAFEAQTNTVIIKGASLINSINMSSGTISVRSKESIDVTTGRKQYGMLLDFNSNGFPRERAVVDYSEMESLLGGIDYLNKITSDVTPLSSFEAVYSTKSAFRVVAYSSRKQGSIQIFIQFDGGPRIPLSSDQVSQFRDLINSAKNSLDALSGGK